MKTKLSNNHPRYQPPIVISDTSQRRQINQASTNNISYGTTVENIYSTSSTIAEGVFLFFLFFIFLYRHGLLTDRKFRAVLIHLIDS